MSLQITKDSTNVHNSSTTDREVTRCVTCGLVQFRTSKGYCRRCVHLLPQRVEFLFRSPKASQAETGKNDGRLSNSAIVENIGQRIRQLRESRGLTQSQLQSKSKVSRSYLSRIESGQMTPSLGTVEKLAAALNVGLAQFLVTPPEGEDLLQDPFILGLCPYLCQLDWRQWQSILKSLRAIGYHVNLSPAILSPIGRQSVSRDAPTNNNIDGHIGTGHSNGAALTPTQRRPMGPTPHKPGFSKL